jgi:hypothetical protein
MKRGQSIIDYVLIFAIVGAALIGMSRYMGRAVRAHAAKTADELGLQENSMKKVGDVKIIQDSSIMYSEEDSQNVVAEQTGGARTTTYGQSSAGYGESIYIAEEEVDQ